MKSTAKKILLYPCNLIGYSRLAILSLVAITVYSYNLLGWEPGFRLRLGLAGWLFISLMILDIVDGYLARKLGHVTKFGVVFDQTIDLLSHTFVWVLSGITLAPLIIAIEWTAGLFATAFILHPTLHWKNMLVQEGPWLVRSYFQSRQLNWLNIYSNIAHFVFPVTLFTVGMANWFAYLMLPGLLIFEVVTLYMIYTFARILVEESKA